MINQCGIKSRFDITAYKKQVNLMDVEVQVSIAALFFCSAADVLLFFIICFGGYCERRVHLAMHLIESGAVLNS